MAANRLVLSGRVCKMPIRKVSPSGVPHCQFVLEHRSIQREAGLNRQSWCMIPVIVSGQQSQTLTHSITIGCNLIVEGFICNQQGRNGLNKLVLHAEQVELIDSGD